MFNYHCVMAALKKEKEKLHMIVFMYALGIGLVGFYILFPDTFILDSIPKMYFPNYYVPGQFQWVMRVIFQVIIPIYFIVELIKSYRSEKENIEKNRIIYFTIGLASAWALGILPILPIWNIWTDPMLGVLFPVFFAIPFVYAILQYQLLDIRIIAKKAFIFGVATACVGVFISALLILDDYVKQVIPQFPFWITPLFSALIAVGVGLVGWDKLRESDVLKYEFITTVTHKFRTPLTHIKWAAENIKTAESKEDQEEQVKYIINADEKLVELTNILANVSDSEKNFKYELILSNLSATINDAVNSLSKEISEKQISLHREIEEGLKAHFDQARFKFVIQVLLENAINYTPNGGNVSILAKRQGRNILISVSDSGIGLTKDEISVMFSKFYRGHNARLVDTEGMGIGLYISQRIVEKHGGRIGVESEGTDKGSNFYFFIPAAE